MPRIRLVAMSAVCLIVLGCAQQQQQSATQQPPFKEVANVQDLMESLVAHMAEDVFASVGTIVDEKGITEIAPKTDEEWDEVAFAALGLAETGNLLMMDSRVNEKAKDRRDDWIQLSQQMIDRSVVAAEKAKAHDAEALLTAGGELYETCQECHMKYIPDSAPPPTTP
jgi:hypothetical protein